MYVSSQVRTAVHRPARNIREDSVFQGDHELPGVVVERAEELGDEQAAKGMRNRAGICSFVLETVHQERPHMVAVRQCLETEVIVSFPLNLYESHNGLSSQRQPEQLHTSLFLGPLHSHQPSKEIPGGSPLGLMSVLVQWNDRVEFKDRLSGRDHAPDQGHL
jgi:hypothetical protein